MSYNTKNLKDKIDRILEQNKRYQQQIPLNFIKGWRQSLSLSNQPKSANSTNQSNVDDRKKNLQINTSMNQGKARSGTSWSGENQQNTRLRISTTPSSTNSHNKENIFRKNEFLSTKNNSVKGNKKKNVEYNFTLTSEGIHLKNQNNNIVNNTNMNNITKNIQDKNQSMSQQDKSFMGKSTTIDTSKVLSVCKQQQYDSQLNNSKETASLNDSNYASNQNYLTNFNALHQNINLNNLSSLQMNNKSPNSSQNPNNNNNLNLTSSSLQSTAAKNQKDNLKLNQTLSITTNFMNTNSPSAAAGFNNGLANSSGPASSKIAASPQSEIVNQLIKIIEQDKKNSAKQYQQFQNHQHQSSLERIRKRESFSLQMRQASQQLDLPTTSKRGSNFGLLDSNNNYYNSDEDNAQRVRELKTKYHLRDAILRQEIKRLEQDNIMLKSTNKQLEEEVTRYRNIRTMENKYVKKLEQELIEEKQKYQNSFKKFANGENISTNNLSNTSGGIQNNIQNGNNNNSSSVLNCQFSIKNVPITQQNAFQVAKQQENVIQTLSEKVSELMSEKEYLEQILKNLLLKNEMDKQNKFESLSFEISQQKPSYLNTSFSDHSCFAQFKVSQNGSFPNMQSSMTQINGNLSSQKQHPQSQNLLNASQICHKQITQIKEEYMEESSRAKTSQTSSQQQSLQHGPQQQQQQQQQQQYVNVNQQLQQQRDNANSLNNILEKNKILSSNTNNTNTNSYNSRNSTPNKNQKRQNSGQRDSTYPPQAPSSLNSVKRYTNRKLYDSSEKNSTTNSVDGFIFGPPKSAHQCSYEEQLINQQQQNNKVIFLENENEEKDEFYWDPTSDEFVINEVQLKNLIEDYKRRAQKVDLL